MKLRYILITIVILLYSCYQNPNKEITKTEYESPYSVSFYSNEQPDSDTISLGNLKEGMKSVLHFYVKNCSESKDLNIDNISSGCGCTTANWEHSTITCGTQREITIIYNSNGQFGKQLKTITITSTDGEQHSIFLTANIEY